MIDSLWSIFGFGDSAEEVEKKLTGKTVTIYGWGWNENGMGTDQLMKQDVKIGPLENRIVELTHKEGHGTCKGDSGGIHRKVY